MAEFMKAWSVARDVLPIVLAPLWNYLGSTRARAGSYPTDAKTDLEQLVLTNARALDQLTAKLTVLEAEHRKCQMRILLLSWSIVLSLILSSVAIVLAALK